MSPAPLYQCPVTEWPAFHGSGAIIPAHGNRCTNSRVQLDEGRCKAHGLRRGGARVSKATVYNTLNLFAARGLIRQLTLDGSCAWFDSNVAPHYHFQDEQTGALSDVALRDVQFSRLPAPPPGMEVAGIDLVIRLRRRG
jgi:hypothetical protein